MQPSDVSAVVCTLNSVSGIQQCLFSLREANVGEIIVVDGGSSDGTREIAAEIADRVLDDPGIGLGNARNIGIAAATGALILNMGSDNVVSQDDLKLMIEELTDGQFDGVSAQTFIEGQDFVSRGLNAWRKGRFLPGPAAVIGTPTLFLGDQLRRDPYDATRRFSDDSELCERWTKMHGSQFAISQARVSEVGKTTWAEVKVRCRMYGISDAEIYRTESQNWNAARKVKSFLHPIRVDFARPMKNLGAKEALQNFAFLSAFTALRYAAWIKASRR